MSARAAALVAVFALAACGRPAREASIPPESIDGVPVSAELLYATYNHVVDSDVMRFDPVAIVRMRAHLDSPHDWVEHDDGEIRLRTNALGLRGAAPVGAPTGRRVLVLGDSHTFGFVDDDECLHERLEALLEERTGETFEVLNAAVGGTGPFEYEGSLRAFAHLGPEAVVVIAYSGNDFRAASITDDMLQGRPKYELTGEVAARLEVVRDAWPRRACLPQGYLQALVFGELGEDAQTRAVGAAHRALTRLATTADELGVPVVFAVLPTKLDVDGADDELVLTAVRDQLGLDAEGYAVNRRMGRALVEALARDGHHVLDLHDAMAAVPEPLFWRKDLHLSTRGHAVVAELLLPSVLAALGED